jgi:hypothetical protein
VKRIHITIAFAIGATLAVVAALGVQKLRRIQALEQSPASPRPTVSLPVEHDGLALSISTDRQTFHVGDQIVVTFTLTNVSSKLRLVFSGTNFHHFVFTDITGRDIAYTTSGDSPPAASQRPAPTESATHKIVLNGWSLAGLGHPYTPIGKEPRTFTLTGLYATPEGLDVFDPDAWFGAIQSKPIQVTIVQ